MCFCLSNSSLSSCRKKNEVCQAVRCLALSGYSNRLVKARQLRGETYLEQEGATWWLPVSEAAQKQSWDSCKRLGRVGRGGGRGVGSGGGDGEEDLLHQGPCSPGCHHLSLLAPVQRTRHSSHGLTGGRMVLEQAGREKGGGHLGPWGAALSLGLAQYPQLGWDQRGALRQG